MSKLLFVFVTVIGSLSALSIDRKPVPAISSSSSQKSLRLLQLNGVGNCGIRRLKFKYEYIICIYIVHGNYEDLCTYCRIFRFKLFMRSRAHVLKMYFIVFTSLEYYGHFSHILFEIRTDGLRGLHVFLHLHFLHFLISLTGESDLIDVRVAGCTTAPCQIRRGQTITIDVDFRVSE